MWLKIPGFCQISSFAGPKWFKISFLSQIFNLTQNICILSNFILLRSKVVKKSQFWIKFFDPTENFWILPNFNLPRNEVVKKLNFWAKFSTQLKYSGFCPISYLQIRSGQKSHFLTKFSTRLKYSGFCQISSFADSEWLKMSILRQIFTPTQNFWILLNSTHRMSWVDKVSVLAKFSQRLKISGFCLISSFAGP